MRLTSANESLELDWKKTWFATLKVEKRSVERAMAVGLAVSRRPGRGKRSDWKAKGLPPNTAECLCNPEAEPGEQ